MSSSTPAQRPFLLIAPAIGAGLVMVLALSALLVQQLGWFGSARWYLRYSPQVDQALTLLKAKQEPSAIGLLNQYLGTGVCKEGVLSVPERVNERADAGFDLGLGYFAAAEKKGPAFGLEPPLPPQAAKAPKSGARFAPERIQNCDCALRILKALGADTRLPVELRARVYTLAGNLELLRGEYTAAVALYDSAVQLIPGIPKGDPRDGIGRDAAWNRAIALRRQEKEQRQKDEEKKKQEKKKDPKQKKDQDQKKEPEDKKDQKNQPEAKKPPEKDPKQGESKPNDPGKTAEKPRKPQPDAASDNSQRTAAQNLDARVLDQLENAEPLQKALARRRAEQLRRRVHEMEDK